MYCNVCQSLLPEGTTQCPHCKARISSLNTEQDEPTQPASHISLPGSNVTPPPPPPPPLSYSSDPYNMSPAPYYQTPVVPATKKRSPIWILMGLLLLILLIGTSFFAYNLTQLNSNQHHLTTNSTPQAKQSTGTTQAQGTNVYPPPSATLIMDDPLHDNGKGFRWDEATMKDKNNNQITYICGFRNSSYHISANNQGGLFCDPEAPQLTLDNLAFEAKLTINAGDEAGIACRFNQTNGQGYLFKIKTNGEYEIDISTNGKLTPLRTGTNAVINQGLHQMNVVGLVLQGSTISAYVNNQYLDSIQDTAYTNGQLAVYGGSNIGPFDIMASGARVWKI